jgi:hypothetical protein
MKTGLILQQQHIYHPTNNILLIIPPTEREKKKKVPNKSILTTEFKKERGETLLSPPDELILRDLHYHTPHDTPTGGITAVSPRPRSRQSSLAGLNSAHVGAAHSFKPVLHYIYKVTNHFMELLQTRER